MSTALSGHQRPNRGQSNEWYTPPEILIALGLMFDLDPASPQWGPVPWMPARKFYTKDDDGLTQPWADLVWLNPPYGQETGLWLARLASHGHGVALVPARTDTRWFHESGILADAFCFLKGRPHFYRPDGTRAPFNSGAPIMLLGYGDTAAHAVERCGLGATMSMFRRAA